MWWLPGWHTPDLLPNKFPDIPRVQCGAATPKNESMKASYLNPFSITKKGACILDLHSGSFDAGFPVKLPIDVRSEIPPPHLKNPGIRSPQIMNR